MDNFCILALRWWETPKWVFMSRSKDPDEIPHNAELYQVLHCLLEQNWSSDKEIEYLLEIISCNPSIYRMAHPVLTVSHLWKSQLVFTHINLASFLWDIGAASDQGSTVCLQNDLLNLNKNENDHPRTLRLEMDLWENTFGIHGLKGLMVKRTYLNSPVCH